PVVLDELHDRVDRLLTEVSVATARQRVRLVDQQTATERFFERLPTLNGGLADEAGDETRPVTLDELALRDHAEGAVDLGEQARDRRLARTRVCGDAEEAALR